MGAYYLFYSFLLSISVFDLLKLHIKSRELFEKILFFILWLVLIFFIGFRYKMANDWHTYEEYIHKIEPIVKVLSGTSVFFNTFNNIEYGFRLLISLINEFFNPFRGSLQALTATISIFCYTILLNFTRKNNTIPYKFIFLSIFISLSMFREFDVFRQSLAFYIFLISLKYYNSNFLKYSLINILGAFFHISAIIFIPLYFVFKIKFTRLFIISLLIIYLFSMFANFSFITSLTNVLSGIFPDLLLIKKLYFTIMIGEAKSSLSLVGLIYSSFLVLLIINYKKIDLNNPEIRLYINLFIIFILINIIFSDAKEVADRLSYYFYIGVAFIFVYFIQYIHKVIITYYLILVLAFPIIRFNRVIANPSTSIVNLPYRNYFLTTPEDDSTILNNWNKKNSIAP